MTKEVLIGYRDILTGSFQVVLAILVINPIFSSDVNWSGIILGVSICAILTLLVGVLSLSIARRY